MPALTRQFSASVGWRSQVVMKTSVTFVRRSARFAASSDLRSAAMCFTPLGRSCLWREMPVTDQPLVAIRCSARWRPIMPETPAINAWRSINSIPSLKSLRSKRHHRAVSGGRLDDGFEDGNVVDEILPGDRIGGLAAHSACKGHEVVFDRLGRRHF